VARRIQNVVPFQPRRLLTFNPAAWLPATGHAAWQRWNDQRFEYLLEHPEQRLDGMDVLDVLYEDPPPWSA
jgi:hypothetical protein